MLWKLHGIKSIATRTVVSDVMRWKIFNIYIYILVVFALPSLPSAITIQVPLPLSNRMLMKFLKTSHHYRISLRYFCCKSSYAFVALFNNKLYARNFRQIFCDDMWCDGRENILYLSYTWFQSKLLECYLIKRFSSSCYHFTCIDIVYVRWQLPN